MRVRTAPFDDAITASDSPDLLLMKNERLIRLGPLGRLIVERAAEGRTLDELLEDAVAAFGPLPPDGPARTVEAAVRGLMDAGLLDLIDDTPGQ